MRVEIATTTTWQQNDQERSRSYSANWPGVVIDPSGIVAVPEHIANRFPAVRDAMKADAPETANTTIELSVSGTKPQVSVQNGRQTTIDAFHILLADGTKIPVMFFGSDDERQFSLVKAISEVSLPAVTIPDNVPELSRLDDALMLSRLESVMESEVATIPSEVIAVLSDGTPVLSHSTSYGAGRGVSSAKQMGASSVFYWIAVSISKTVAVGIVRRIRLYQ